MKVGQLARCIVLAAGASALLAGCEAGPATPAPTPEPTHAGLATATLNVCHGGPADPFAPPYAGTTHPLVVEGWAFSDQGDLMTGQPEEAVQLVACLDDSWDDVSWPGAPLHCAYENGQTFQVGLRHERVTVVILSTGQTLATTTILGPLPDSCPPALRAPMGSPAASVGPLPGPGVPYPQVFAYLEQFVHGPVR